VHDSAAMQAVYLLAISTMCSHNQTLSKDTNKITIKRTYFDKNLLHDTKTRKIPRAAKRNFITVKKTFIKAHQVNDKKNIDAQTMRSTYSR